MNCHESYERKGRRLGVEVGMSYTLGLLLHFANKSLFFIFHNILYPKAQGGGGEKATGEEKGSRGCGS